jgi:hypothetical protein
MSNRYTKENIETVSKKYVGLEYGPFVITKFVGRYAPTGEVHERNYFEKECKFCGRKTTINTTIIKKQLKEEPICRCRGKVNIHTNEKKCTCCDKWFPATSEYFHKLGNRSFNLSYYCIKCDNEKSGVRRKRYREKQPKSIRTRNHTGTKKPIETIDNDVIKLNEEFLGKEFGSFVVISYDGRYKKGNSPHERYYFKKECKFCGKQTIQPVSQLRTSIKNEIKCNYCKESVNIHTNEKKCADCNVWYPATYEHFPQSKNRFFGIHYYCLECHNKKGRTRRESKEVRQKEYEQKKVRMETDVLFKMTCRIKTNIKIYVNKHRLKGTGKKRKHDKSSMIQILGCDYIFFKEWIESKFTEGMTWNNYGEWHYEHLIPTSYAETIDELYELCHHTNYRPMWGGENLSKSNKLYVDEIPEELRIKFKKYIDRYIDNPRYVRYTT